jgi:hypothetical protein
MGVRTESFEIEDSILENYFMGLLVRNRVTNFRFWVVNIYGPTQHTLSDDFIQEISSFCLNISLPIVMGGDFNLIRNNKERNHGLGDQRLMNLFNNFIGQFQLRKIFCSGTRFTWSNKQQHPTLIKLDRILVSTNWEMFYPTCFAWAKSRIGFDHCPLFLNTGEQGAARPRYFFFEEQWFQREGFLSMIQEKWDLLKNDHAYSLDRWHGCLSFLRRYLRGWNL